MNELISLLITNFTTHYKEENMNPKVLDAAEAKSRVLQVLAKNPFVSLATFGIDGYPDVRVLLVAANDDTDAIWFATGTDSPKTVQFRNNPKAVIYGYDMESMTEFRLYGSVELLSDSASRRKIWRDEFVEHFPDGVDSPTMTVLRFKTDRGIYDNYGKETGKF
ncbi:MAG: pyridoxamine 5'-phosphate oxidase family protein [Planctomycetaceae bacterium]|nr:pyridoxamine 5'-phosphate oxidase family protein [Planctomycetaceae bacterium]